MKRSKQVVGWIKRGLPPEPNYCQKYGLTAIHHPLLHAAALSLEQLSPERGVHLRDYLKKRIAFEFPRLPSVPEDTECAFHTAWWCIVAEATDATKQYMDFWDAVERARLLAHWLPWFVRIRITAVAVLSYMGDPKYVQGCIEDLRAWDAYLQRADLPDVAVLNAVSNCRQIFSRTDFGYRRVKPLLHHENFKIRQCARIANLAISIREQTSPSESVYPDESWEGLETTPSLWRARFHYCAVAFFMNDHGDVERQMKRLRSIGHLPAPELLGLALRYWPVLLRQYRQGKVQLAQVRQYMKELIRLKHVGAISGLLEHKYVYLFLRALRRTNDVSLDDLKLSIQAIYGSARDGLSTRTDRTDRIRSVILENSITSRENYVFHGAEETWVDFVHPRHDAFPVQDKILVKLKRIQRRLLGQSDTTDIFVHYVDHVLLSLVVTKDQVYWRFLDENDLHQRDRLICRCGDAHSANAAHWMSLGDTSDWLLPSGIPISVWRSTNQIRLHVMSQIERYPWLWASYAGKPLIDFAPILCERYTAEDEKPGLVRDGQVVEGSSTFFFLTNSGSASKYTIWTLVSSDGIPLEISEMSIGRLAAARDECKEFAYRYGGEALALELGSFHHALQEPYLVYVASHAQQIHEVEKAYLIDPVLVVDEGFISRTDLTPLPGGTVRSPVIFACCDSKPLAEWVVDQGAPWSLAFTAEVDDSSVGAFLRFFLDELLLCKKGPEGALQSAVQAARDASMPPVLWGAAVLIVP